MSFVPLTFSMGMQDKGVLGGLDKAKKTLQGINATMNEAGRLGDQMGAPFRGLGKVMSAPFKMFGGALAAVERRVAQFNLASIAEDIKGLAGQTGNLSDELDSAFASNAKAVKPMLAAIGKSGAELKKLTGKAAGMAYSMNVGADAVGKVMVAMETAGGPAKAAIEELNMSTKDFIKLAEVSGIETKDLLSNMADLQTSWGFSAKEAADTTNQMLAYGQAVGIGSQGLVQFKPLLEKANTVMGSLPPNMQLTTKEMQSMAISTVKLSGAFIEMGDDSETAMTNAMSTSEMFIKEYAAYQKAQIDGSQEYGDVTKSMMSILADQGMTYEDFGALLKAGATDSTQGVMQLQSVVQQLAGKNGLGPANVLMGDLLKGVTETSPALSWLAQNVGKGEEALKKFSGMTVDSTGALKKFANEGFSTGFTLQETFNMARKGMEHAVRAISNKETTNYVKMQVKAYHEVGQEMQGLGSSKTWGPLIKNLSLLKRAGLQGVIMSMFPDKKGKMEVGKTFAKLDLLGGAIDSVSQAAAPLMTTLGKFGPLGTMAGGLATWFSIPKAARDKLITDMEPAFAEIKKGAWSAWGTIQESIREKLPGIKEDLTKLWNDSIVPFFKDNAPKVGNAILDALKWAWNKVGEYLGTGGQLAIGAAALGAVGGSGLLGAAMSMTKTIASSFGQGGNVYVAAALLGASLGAWIGNKISDSITNSKNKSEGLISNNIQNNALLMKQKSESSIALRRETFGQMGVGELAAGISAGEMSGQELNKFIGKKTNYAEAFKSSKQYQNIFKGIFKDSTGAGEDAADAALYGFTQKLNRYQDLPEIQSALSDIMSMSAKNWKGAGTQMQALDLFMDPDKMKSAIEEFKAQQKMVLDASTMVDLGQFDETTQAAGLEGFRSKMSAGLEALNGSAYAGGQSVVNMMADGVSSEQDYLIDTMDSAIQTGVDDFLPQSPAAAGPLWGVSDTDNPMYNAGFSVMELMSKGILDGAFQLQIAMTDALIESFKAAMGTYEEYAGKRIIASDVMVKVADQLIQQLGGVGKIDLTPQEKQILKTNIDVPGMAGVTGAIIADGALTRKVLMRIAEATEGTFKIMGNRGSSTTGVPITA